MRSQKTLRPGLHMAALGMIYGDIGTSVLYVMKYIAAEGGASGEESVLGALSLILWTLLILTTGKGVLLLLRADNRGEGGHFALYALVRERGKWLLIPAALGGAALLADSVLTPALTVTAALEGLQVLPAFGSMKADSRLIPAAAMVFLTAVYALQGRGNRKTARFFGPVMLVWFGFIGAAGAAWTAAVPAVLRAVNPLLGLRFLFSAGNTLGPALLALAFLAATGTEILYANLDFSGRKAIQLAWPFVLLCILLSYFGQGAWLLSQLGSGMTSAGTAADPFFQMLPAALRLPALLLAAAAAWITVQTVVNSSTTLVSEAIRLDLLPPLEIRYPSDTILQEYIPAVNFLMWLLGCAAVALFRSGQRMAGVYGLMIAAAMLTTTVMLFVYYRDADRRRRWICCVLPVFGVMETAFLLASAGKLLRGGNVTALLTLLLYAVMMAWNRGQEVEKRFSTRLPLRNYVSQLEQLRARRDLIKAADNLVYMDAGEDMDSVDASALYSILDRGQKRADTYWFVTVTTVSEPYVQRYRVNSFGTDCVFRVVMELGYKCSLPLTEYLEDVFLDRERQGLAPTVRKEYRLSDDSAWGSFHYCILRKRPTGEERFTVPELWSLRLRNLLQSLTGVRREWYTAENTDVETEWLPLSLEEACPAQRIRRRPKEADPPNSMD